MRSEVLIVLVNVSVVYMHKVHTGFWDDVTNPEEFGFASTSFFLWFFF
jgi:hypothetical protein